MSAANTCWSTEESIEDILAHHARACRVSDDRASVVAPCEHRSIEQIVRDYLSELPLDAAPGEPDTWMEGSVTVFSQARGFVESVCFFYRADRSFQFDTPHGECRADGLRY